MQSSTCYCNDQGKQNIIYLKTKLIIIFLITQLIEKIKYSGSISF